MIKLGDKVEWNKDVYTCIDFRETFECEVSEPYGMIKQPYNQPMTWCYESLEELQEELDIMKEKYGDNFNYI